MARGRLGQDKIQELSSIAVRGGQFIQNLYGEDSQYARSWKKALATNGFTDVHSNHFEHVSELCGILKGAQHDLKSGLLDNMRLLLQGEIFADFLEMAEHLLDTGYKDAAAVLLGGVLEDSLRKIASSTGVATTGANGKPFTIDPLNVALAKAGIYGPLVQKQITTWANLRNDAAHGNYSKYDAEQTRQMLLFVQKFCGDFLK
ncbi:MAG TPA: hypothetical protein VJ860_20820 [Polyangia bacterium]|jgi:hypothetical protein|nr:hypothetical protein [Polyangia bacterium]